MKSGTRHHTIATRGRTLSVRGVVGDYLDITWRMVIPTLLGIGLGHIIDTSIHTHPAGFLVGAVVGFGVGLWMAIMALIGRDNSDGGSHD